jgi:cytochrome b561
LISINGSARAFVDKTPEVVPMQLRNTQTHYGLIPQALHWAVVVTIIVAWVLGTFDDLFPKGPARAAALFVHVSAGLAVIVFVDVRLLWRIGNPPPRPEKTPLSPWMDHAGRLAHYALYALLIAVPVVGIDVQFARGDALSLFGLSDIPSPWLANRAFARNVKQVHEILAHALVILAGLHAAAALVHHWIFRDRTLVRMLPRTTR